jgi:hypothetical protein
MSESSNYKRVRKLTYDWEKYFAYDSSDTEVEEFFSKDKPNSAVNDENSIFYKKILWDVFVYAMAVGRYIGTPKPFTRKTGTIPIEFAKEHHVVAILGVVFSINDIDLSILKQPKEIRNICESYANAGVEKLIEFKKTREHNNPLSEYESEFLKFLKQNKSNK